MPLAKQGNELVHAVGQGGRDETEAGCVTVDQVGVSARAFKCLLEVTLRPIHSKLKGANAVHRTAFAAKQNMLQEHYVCKA